MVLWDYEQFSGQQRVRIWTVQCQTDTEFINMCETWYYKLSIGEIRSTKFQLHLPRNKNNNIIRNTCGNLEYPLILEAVWNIQQKSYDVKTFEPELLTTGFCKKVN